MINDSVKPFFEIFELLHPASFAIFHLSWSLRYKNTLFRLKLKYVRKNPSEASNGQTSQIAAKIEVDSWEIGQTTLFWREIKAISLFRIELSILNLVWYVSGL